MSLCQVLGPSTTATAPRPPSGPEGPWGWLRTHLDATPRDASTAAWPRPPTLGGRAPPSPERAPRWATCSDTEGHGGHLSLLLLPHAGSNYGLNCSSRLEEMPSAQADRWPLLMHDALAGDGCARPPATGLDPPASCLCPSGRAGGTELGLGKGLTPSLLQPGPEHRLRAVLDVSVQCGRPGPGQHTPGWSASTVWLELWPRCQTGLAQDGPHHPCHIPGDHKVSCRGRSQLSACLLTNSSVFPITSGSDPLAAGGSSSPLCSFPVFSSFSQTPLLHPQFYSPQLGVVMPNLAASPLAHPGPRSTSKPGWSNPPGWDAHPCASHLGMTPIPLG